MFSRHILVSPKLAQNPAGGGTKKSTWKQIQLQLLHSGKPNKGESSRAEPSRAEVLCSGKAPLLTSPSCCKATSRSRSVFFSRPFPPAAKFKPPAPARFALGPAGPGGTQSQCSPLLWCIYAQQSKRLLGLLYRKLSAACKWNL